MRLIGERALFYLIIGIAASATCVSAVVIGISLMDDSNRTAIKNNHTNTNKTNATAIPAGMHCLFGSTICYTVPANVTTTRQ